METSNGNSLRSEDIAEYLYEHIEDEGIESLAKEFGLQRVKRGNIYYYRRIPERLTGKALESAVAFGAINKAVGGKYNGKKINYKGHLINYEIYVAAKAFKDKRFVETPDIHSETVGKIQKLLEEATEKEV